MAEVKTFSETVSILIDTFHQSKQWHRRTHMGASLLGHDCDRYIWLVFRWALPQDTPGRILRLFRRGNLEEMQIKNDLRSIGCVFQDENAIVQLRSGHVAGTPDGVILKGVPTAEQSTHILECKTHNKNSFNKLEKEGVQKSKPQHYAQCQVYMLFSGIDRALYAAVCKDDDRLYFERIHLDKEYAKRMVARGQQIAMAERMPDGISNNPSWYVCKMCAGYSFCHKGEVCKEKNCRTCIFTECPDIPSEKCKKHQFHHDLNGSAGQ